MKTTQIILHLLLSTFVLLVSNYDLHARNNFDFTPPINGYSGQQKVFVADMNSDGFDDIIMCDNSNIVTISMNDGDFTFTSYNSNMHFNTGTYATINLGSKQLIGVSDMTGDGKGDLLVYDNNYNATIDDALLQYDNTGNGFNTPNAIAVFPHYAWQFYTGSMNTANLKEDIIGYNSVTGDIHVLLDGAGSFNNWAIIAAATNPTFYFGDFAGTPDNDLAYSYQDVTNTYINVLETNAGLTAFGTTFFQSTISTLNLLFIAGNFNNNGKVDLAVNFPAADEIKLLENNVGSFTLSAVWGVASYPALSFKYTGGNFAGEGKEEILKLYANNPDYQGSINLLFSNTANTKFNINTWELAQGNGSLSPASNDWQMINADFNNDGMTDILCYNPTVNNGNGKIKVGLNKPKLQGYCWPLSGKAGDPPITFHVSGKGSNVIDILKFESVDNTVTSSLVTSVAISPPTIIASADNDYKDGCGWPVSFSLTIDPAWESGYYAAKLIDERGRDEYVTFIVTKNTPGTKKVALIANTNTWWMYNPWSRVEDGRGSKYSNEYNRDYSFLRPNPTARPTTYNFASEYNNANLMGNTRAELWIYTWLKNNGYEPNVITDVDVHLNSSNFLNDYAYLIMGTHPEYWTGQMFDNVKNFQQQGAGFNGGNLICIGGNAVFEACDIDLTGGNKKIVAFPGTANASQFPIINQVINCGPSISGGQAGGSPIAGHFDRYDYFLDTYEFPGAVKKRSMDLIGVHYQTINNFDYNTTTSYDISNPGFILFDGIIIPTIGTVGYNLGYTLQTGGSMAGGASGRETECYTFPQAGAQVANYFGIDPSSIYSPTIQVVAQATPNCFTPPPPTANCPNYTGSCSDFPNGANYSEIIYVKPECDANNRGFVFTAGSITFGGSLAVDAGIQTMMKNVLDHLEITINATNPICAGANTGHITISVPMANANSIFTLNPGNFTNNTGIFNGLPANIYTVTATYGDNNTYTVCKVVELTAISSPVWTTTNFTNITCNNANDGTISVLLTGGIGIVNYNLQPGNNRYNKLYIATK